MNRRLYIETVGCQMNVLDSELVAAGVARARATSWSTSPRQADVDPLQHVQRPPARRGQGLQRPGPAEARQGAQPATRSSACSAAWRRRTRPLIFRRAPHVDLVVGPGQLGQVPELIERDRRRRGPADRGQPGPQGGQPRAMPGGASSRSIPSARSRPGRRPHQAMVRIMFGCDKFCTYCIVPSVRGPEQSRPADEIEAEVRRLADAGLPGDHAAGPDGQQLPVARRRADVCGWPTCSRRLHDDRGPRAAEVRHQLPAAHDRRPARGGPRPAQGVALPARAGAERLERGAAADEAGLHGRASTARCSTGFAATVPGAAVTSDFIVGFCGETEEDFQQTVDLVREARFKNSFIFKYSPRPGTKAAELYADDVPEEVKRRRNNELLAVQNAISEEDNRPLVGRTVEILVEGPSKTSRKRAEAGRGHAIGRPDGLRPDRRVRGPPGVDRPTRAGDDSQGRRVHAVRRGGERHTVGGKRRGFPGKNTYSGLLGGIWTIPAKADPASPRESNRFYLRSR